MTDAIRSEWIKLRSARSNFVLLILAAAIPVALTLLLAFTVQPEDLTAEDTFDLVLVGDYIGQLLIGVLGVLVIGQEYRHTTIRVTFTADPNRGRVMTAKALVVAATGLVIGGVTTFFSYVLGNAILTSRDMELVLEGSTQLRALAGAVILFALYGLVGLGLGAIIRATAGAITLLVVWPVVVESIDQRLLPQVRTLAAVQRRKPADEHVQHVRRRGGPDPTGRWSSCSRSSPLCCCSSDRPSSSGATPEPP